MNRNEQYYRHIMGAIGATMLFFLLFINVFGVLLGLVETFGLFSILRDYAVSETLYQLIYGGGYLLCFMLPVPIFKRLIKRKGHPYYPMQAPLSATLWLLLIAPALTALAFSASYVNSYIVDLFLFSTPVTEFAENVASYQPFEIVLEFIVIAIVPGFCEEFLFRGAILSNLLPFGRSNAILISALFFALMHQNPSQLFYTFVAGILLGVVYERTGSIWNTTILHVFNNLISVILTVVATNASSGTQAILLGTLLECALYAVGVVAAVVLTVRFFSVRCNFENGIFGSSTQSLNVVPACFVERKRAVRLFFTPTVIIFIALVALSVFGLLFVMAVGNVLA